MQKSMWNTFMMRSKIWIEHLIRNYYWITTITEGKPDGESERGRFRTPFKKQLMGDTGIQSYIEIKRTIRDREKWKKTSIILRIEKIIYNYKHSCEVWSPHSPRKPKTNCISIHLEENRFGECERKTNIGFECFRNLHIVEQIQIR